MVGAVQSSSPSHPGWQLSPAQYWPSGQSGTQPLVVVGVVVASVDGSPVVPSVVVGAVVPGSGPVVDVCASVAVTEVIDVIGEVLVAPVA